ncbi:MAG: geranylgeranyl reductase family protein [Candidatus Thorarchaeota archaeon]
MSETYDVIVVGAGPAGTSAAIFCQQNSLNTLLLDSKPRNEIGDKVCGEAISKKTVHKVSEKLNVEPPIGEEINTNVEKLVLRTSLPIDHISLPAIGYMVDRHIYGQRLLKEAAKAGVKIQDNTKVVSAIIENNEVKGVKIRNKQGKNENIFSLIVIDCSGIQAVVRTNLPENFEPLLNKKISKADYASCYREIIELNDDHNLDGKIVLQYEESIPKPGYIWFFADGKKKLNCGTGFIKTGKNKEKSVKTIYFNAIEKYYPKGTYKTLEGRGGTVPIRPPLWNAVAPGFIVAGDAAFHADPLTAEGHGPALLAGYYAAKISINAIKNKRFSTENLWEYNKLIMEDFGNEHARYRILTIALNKLGVKNLEFLLKREVIKKSDLTSELVTKKESFLSLLGRVTRCFPRLHLLLIVKKAMSLSKKIDELCRNYPNSPHTFVEWKKKIEKIYRKLE